MDRLEVVLKEKGSTNFARIDHAAGAAKIGKQLRPTEVLIFGNPQGGTPFMECSQTVGIDLPLKALVWADESGQVFCLGCGRQVSGPSAYFSIAPCRPTLRPGLHGAADLRRANDREPGFDLGYVPVVRQHFHYLTGCRYRFGNKPVHDRLCCP